MKQKGLGRGLDAIFGTENIAAKVTPMSHMAQIPIGQIVPNPSQPRTSFDEEALRELSDSIRQLGIIQPITVRRDGTDRYIIISGERRWRASRMAGLETLPAYVREADDENLHAMALVENIQRQDLNAIEIALGMQRLIDECGLTQEQMADKVGKKRSTVSNYMRLLTLPDEVQLALKEGLISMGHAKALAALPRQMQVKALKKCLRGGLSVRQTEELARKAAQTPAPVPAPEEEEYPESYSRLVEQLVDVQVNLDNLAFFVVSGVFGHRFLCRLVGCFFLAHGLFEHAAVDYHCALRHIVLYYVESYYGVVEVHVFVEAVHLVEFSGVNPEFYGCRIFQLESFALLECNVLDAYTLQICQVVVGQLFEQHLRVRLHYAVIATIPNAVAAARGIDEIEIVVAVVYDVSVECGCVQMFDFGGFVAEYNVESLAFRCLLCFRCLFLFRSGLPGVCYCRRFIFAWLVAPEFAFRRYSAVGIDYHAFLYEHWCLETVILCHICDVAFYLNHFTSACGIEVAYRITCFHICMF